MIITQPILVEISCYPEFSKTKGFHSVGKMKVDGHTDKSETI